MRALVRPARDPRPRRTLRPGWPTAVDRTWRGGRRCVARLLHAPRAGPVPGAWFVDGGRVHARVPAPRAAGPDPERRLPPPLWTGIAPRPRRLVRGVRLHARSRAGLRPAPEPRDRVRAVCVDAAVGPNRCRGSRCRGSAVDDDADRSRGARMARGRGACTLVGRLRDSSPQHRCGVVVGRRRTARRVRTVVPSRHRDRGVAHHRGCRVGPPPRRPAAGTDRRSGRLDPDVDPPGDRRTRSGDRRDRGRSGRPTPTGSGTAQSPVVRRDRRCTPGDRRGRSAVLATSGACRRITNSSSGSSP